MKKILFFSVLISLMFVFSETRSQDDPDISCPEGWTSGTASSFIHNPYNNEDCEYKIYFCWMIDENGNIVVRLRAGVFYDKTKLAGLDLASAAIWNVFTEVMLNSIKDEISSQVPPCPSSIRSISLQRVNCWHLQDLSTIFKITYGFINPNHSYFGIAPCDVWGGYCGPEYSLCLDYSVSPPELITTLIPQLPVGITCPVSSVPFDPTAPISTECFSTCY